MGSPIFNIMGNRNNPMNMLSAFNQFRKNFKGDPRAQVQELLNSGKMTQAQYNQLSNMANQFRNMFK